MIIDHRTYYTAPTRTGDFLDLWERMALPYQLKYLEGRVAELRAEPEVALEYYEAVIANGARRPRLRAAVARTNILLEDKKLTPEQAIVELEAHSFSWRGDKYEIALLGQLARLRLNVSDYPNALALMRRVATNFPDHPDSRKLAQKMNEVFADLFLEGRADALNPVTALALYYEFQELTPVGRRGDEMIRRLADRLVQVDLLDRAARLLEHQVNYRLKGVERARVAARLALIYLFAKRPDDARDILEKTEKTKALPESMIIERRHLMARAMTDLDRSGEALVLLEGDRSRAADLLRSEIAWQAENWPDVATVARRLLPVASAADLPLSEVDAVNVIRLAVALYMSEDLTALDDIKSQYESQMAASKHAETFRVLTHKVVPSKTKFRSLASALAGIGDLEAFLTSYRARLANEGLGAIN